MSAHDSSADVPRPRSPWAVLRGAFWVLGVLFTINAAAAWAEALDLRTEIPRPDVGEALIWSALAAPVLASAILGFRSPIRKVLMVVAVIAAAIEISILIALLHLASEG